MKGTSVLAAAALVMANSALADSYFVGAEVGYTEASFSSVTDTTDFTYETGDVIYGIRGGYIYQDVHRVKLSLDYNEKDFATGKKFEQLDLLASYDYLVPMHNAPSYLYLGVTGGYSDIEFTSGKKADDSDFSYGAQIGVGYKVDQQVSIEAGFHYLSTDVKADTGTESFTWDDSQRFIIAVDYLF